MRINSNIKLSKLVNIDYHILPVLNRFGICTGFGDKTIEQVCKEKDINLHFFLEIVNAFLDKTYVPDIDAAKFTISELIDYLRQTHKYYRSKLQFIEYLLGQVINNCCVSERQKIEMVLRFFGEYKTELIQHIELEDKVIYPQILRLEEAYNKGEKIEIQPEYTVESYFQEHVNVGDKIVDVKTIILKYLPLSEPSEECNQLLFDLYDFENDLLNHQSIEERVLIPMALRIEQKIRRL